MKQALKAALLLSLTLAAATTAPGKPVTVDELLVNAPPGDWRSPDPDNTLYLEIPGGRVVIELAPRIAPLHIANIKSLTRARYFDGLAIVRVQDNYVVQWNDRDHQKPIPPASQPAEIRTQATSGSPIAMAWSASAGTIPLKVTGPKCTP
jgi:hypothetical protein